MHHIESWLSRCVAGAAVCAVSMTAFGDQGSYQVDESKLPEWVRRQGNSPYKVIIESSTVHIRPAGRAASGALSKKPAPPPIAAVPAVPAAKVAVAADKALSAPPGKSTPVSLASAPLAGSAGAPESPGIAQAPPKTSTPSTARESDHATLVPAAVLLPPPQSQPDVAVAMAALPTPRAPSIGALCPNQMVPAMPRGAADQGIGGTVKVRAWVQGGVVKEVTILSGPPIFHSAVRTAMKGYRCQPGETRVSVEQEFVFEID